MTDEIKDDVLAFLNGDHEADRARVRAEARREALGDAWRTVESGLPESDRVVLVAFKNSYGKVRRLRGCWIAARTVEADDTGDNPEWFDCSENMETYWYPEGWYECTDETPDAFYWFLSDKVTHWMPLPEPPRALMDEPREGEEES